MVEAAVEERDEEDPELCCEGVGSFYDSSVETRESEKRVRSKSMARQSKCVTDNSIGGSRGGCGRAR